MNVLRIAYLLLAWGFCISANACSCYARSAYGDKEFVDGLYTKADVIVHARVESLITDNEARIQVIESFKGQPTVLRAVPGDDAKCGTRFRVGEEALYVAYRGVVNYCGKIPPREEFLKTFREARR